LESGRWREIDDLFAEALDRPPAERGAFLDAACGGDPELRREVERLLAADSESQATFLERPVGELLGLVPDRSDRAGEPARLGHYRLLGRLGGGGMGDVFRARREDEHYEQEVAIKILRSGLGPEALQRFLIERQILARLEHPNIARLYDGGSTEDGRPYLVMELVEGLPVDEYCDRHQLDVDQRLDLFRRICAAVQYAHQNLLVHRDLKPGNILVTAAGEPKLLDFGIAKRLERGPATQPDLTQTGSRIMTPSYASPEQVKGEPITTASDVYSLGVLLYGLLAGRGPYRNGLGRLPHEIERAICEEAPERPSVALFRPGAPPMAEEIGRDRRARPQALRRRLQGDLDNVVLMALRKEPERRYGSAAQLAGDLESHLQSLPVVARPDTLPYRARKFLRRHRTGVAAAAVVVLLAVLFMVSLVAQGRRVARERDKARYALGFLVDTFKEADPYHTQGERLTADEILSRGAERVSRDLTGQPDVQAALMDAIGEVELGLGRYDRAEPLLKQGLALRRGLFGPESLETAESLEHLGRLRQDRSAFADSEALLRQALEIKRRRLGDRDLGVARTLDALGTLLTARGGAGEAEKLHREALDIALKVEGPVGPTVASSLLALGKAKLAQGNYLAAERISRQGLVVQRGVLGTRDPRFYRVQTDVAEVLLETGKYKEAETLLRRSLAAQRELLGRDHPDVTVTLAGLATALLRQGRWEESAAAGREALGIVRARLGPSHWLVDALLGDLAAAIGAQGRPAAAIPYYEEVLEIRRRNYGPRSPQAAQVLLQLAAAYRSLKQYPEALRFAQDGLEILEQAGDPRLASALREVGLDHLDAGRPAQAETYLRKALAAGKEDLPHGHPEVAGAKTSLAECLIELRRFDEAAVLLREARTSLSRQAGNEDRLKRVGELEERLRRLRPAAAS